MRKLLYILAACTVSISLFTACTDNSKILYDQSSIIMDTPINLKAYGPNGQKAVKESMDRLHAIEDMSSATKANSDVDKINKAAGKLYVKVHPEIMKMIKASLEFSKLSGGAWDITTGPLINLWGIGTDAQRVPSEAEIKSKLPLVGYDKISIKEQDSSVMLQKEGMAIDLGGIAKGFAADEVLKIYKKYNIQNGLINLGSSSIYAVGKNQDNTPWGIGIKHPRSEGSDTYLGVIKISDQALSTSGDSERFFIKDNKRYHHIMNPFTGYPADTGVMSDTIVVQTTTPDCNMVADLLTTTVFVLGHEKGIQFVENLKGVSCEITTTDFKIYTSSGFKDKILDLNKDFRLTAQ